jgi:serine/threonine protein kinase
MEHVADTVFRTGERIGDYRLVECIGIGASGEIWKALDRHDSVVALKLLIRGPHAARDQVRRFIREGNVLSELKHQGICRTYEMRGAEGVFYIAMEYVEGVNLGRLLRLLADPANVSTVLSARSGAVTIATIIDSLERAGPVVTEAGEEASGAHTGGGPVRLLPLQQALAIVEKLCGAMQFAHERGVLHRDIKPSNIMLRRTGEPVILDFGIAKVLDGGEQALTRTGKIFGTIEYMAPEQARASRHIDERADVYSIGAVLYQLVTGRKHFVRSGDLYRDVRRLEGYEPIRPRLHSKAIDQELEAIMLKALDPRPARRYRSARRLAEDIRRYQNSEPVTAKKATPLYLMRKFIGKNRFVLSFSAAIVVLLALFAAYFAWDHYRQWGRWSCVYRRDFTVAPYPAEDFVFVGRDAERVESWKADSLGLLMRRFQTCWLRQVRIAGDVRVALRFRYTGMPDGLEVMINAHHDTLAAWYHVPRGYSCQYGGYYGSLAFIAVNERAGLPVLKDFAYPAAPRDRAVELVFERRGGTISLIVDGERLLTEEHGLPFEGGTFSRIGFRCYTTTVHLQSLDVYHMALPERVSPLVAGDALIAEGLVEEGVNSYLQTAGDFSGSSLGARALVRAYVAASRHPAPRRRHVADSVKGLLSRAYPRSPLWKVVDETELIGLWDEGRFDEALGRLGPHCRKHPDTDIAQRLLASAPDSIKLRLLPFLRRLGRFMEINLDSLGLNSLEYLTGCDPLKISCIHNGAIRDLSPLGAMDNLMWLDCEGNAVEELTALAGKSLFYLDASRNRLRDISPLQGMPLKMVHLETNGITDLKPLAGCPARLLGLERNDIEDLTPLRGMPVVNLSVGGNRIADLSPLRGMELIRLSCPRNRIGSLAPLEKMPLTFLNCSDNPIEDLAALRGMPLRELWAERCDIQSLAPLADMPLHRLAIDGNRIADLAPLHRLRLTYLNCSDNRITTLAPLRGMPLAILACGGNRFTSLEPLTGMPLQRLSLNRSSVPDSSTVLSLEPLRGMALREFSCMNQPVASLEPLGGMPLTAVNCQGSSPRSLGPFVSHPPARFYFYCESLPLGELRRAERVWRYDSTTVALARRARLYRLVRTGRWEELRRMAHPFRGHHYLVVPIYASYPEALRRARQAGGRLVSIEDEEEYAFVHRLSNDNAWLALERRSGRWMWGSGTPLSAKRAGVLERDWREGMRAYLGPAGAIRLGRQNVLPLTIIEWEGGRQEGEIERKQAQTHGNGATKGAGNVY